MRARCLWYVFVAGWLSDSERDCNRYHCEHRFEHLQQLSHYFYEYFGDDDTNMFDWIRNPFKCLLTDFIGREQEQLAELSSDTNRMLLLDGMFPGVFTDVRHSSQYPVAIYNHLLVWNSLSAVTGMKTKCRSRLNIDDDIRVCMSHISPRLDKLCSAKREQPSH